jgi:hypothetical protein
MDLRSVAARVNSCLTVFAPHCITGFGFRRMVENTCGEHVRPRCGHLVYPSEENHCSCSRGQANRSAVEIFTRGAALPDVVNQALLRCPVRECWPGYVLFAGKKRQAGRAEDVVTEIATLGMERANGYTTVGAATLRLTTTGCAEGILEAPHFDHTAIAHDGASFRRAGLYHEGYQGLWSEAFPFCLSRLGFTGLATFNRELPGRMFYQPLEHTPPPRRYGTHTCGAPPARSFGFAYRRRVPPELSAGNR